MVKITISGKPGSGKTTIGKILAKKLNLKFYSIGDLRGQIAQKKGLTIDQLNEIGIRESWTDKEVDDFQKEFGKKEDNFVVDGRLSWKFIPDSIKIFLDVKKEVGAKRIFNDNRADEFKGQDWKDQMQKINERITSDKKRYMKHYGINFEDKYNYNIALDTSNLNKEEVVDELIAKIEKINRKNAIMKSRRFL